MRVTNGMIRNNSINSLYNNMGRLDTLFNQMNTLKKIQRPSDDPIIAGRSLKLRLNVMETEQYESNVDEANAWMNVTETALTNMTEILKEIRTRCVQASNDTLTPDDRNKIMSDIDQLYQQLQQEANGTYAGRYIFSGYKTDQSVYLTQDTELTKDVTLGGSIQLSQDTDLSGVVFAEDITLPDGTILAAGTAVPDGTVFAAGTQLPTGTMLPAGTTLPKGTMNPAVIGNTSGQYMEYEIGVGTTIEVNTLGVPELMSKIGDDIKQMMSVLEDPDADYNELFTGMLDNIDQSLAALSEMTAELGSKQSRLEYTETRLVDDKANFTELLSKTEDVDIEEVYVDFNTQYMVYQSALQATSKVIMNSLADFLR